MDMDAVVKKRKAPTAEEAAEEHRAMMAAIDDYQKQFVLLAARAAKRAKARGPHFRKDVFRGKGSVGGEPSDALAVHPKQVEEAVKFCKDRGVPTEYTPGGRPVIRSIQHQREHAKIRGFHPKRD